MDWLVDTNILVDHLRGVSKATTFLRQARSAGTLWISAVTVAEVYAGQRTRQAKQAAKVSRLLQPLSNRIRRWGCREAWRRDNSRLRDGLPDALIAATAVRKGLVLATRNTFHFANIADLDVRPPY